MIVLNHIVWHSYLWNWRNQNDEPSKCKNLLNYDENWHSVVIEVADYESSLKFRNLKWRIQYGRSVCKSFLSSGENWYSRGFSGSLIMNLQWNFLIQNIGSNMAGRYVKICGIRMKIGTRGFFRSLITNLYLKFWNSKLRMKILKIAARE